MGSLECSKRLLGLRISFRFRIRDDEATFRLNRGPPEFPTKGLVDPCGPIARCGTGLGGVERGLGIRHCQDLEESPIKIVGQQVTPAGIQQPTESRIRSASGSLGLALKPCAAELPRP